MESPLIEALWETPTSSLTAPTERVGDEICSNIEEQISETVMGMAKACDLQQCWLSAKEVNRAFDNDGPDSSGETWETGTKIDLA